MRWDEMRWETYPLPLFTFPRVPFFPRWLLPIFFLANTSVSPFQDIFWEFEDGVTAIVAYQQEGQHTRKLIGGVEISFTLKKELLSAWKPVTRLSLNVLGGSGADIRRKLMSDGTKIFATRFFL